jgi:hypothetical protein
MRASLASRDVKQPVARIERSESRDNFDASTQLPAFTPFNPGYEVRKIREAERRQT